MLKFTKISGCFSSVFIISTALLIMAAIQTRTLAQQPIHSADNGTELEQTDADGPHGITLPFSFVPSSITPPPGLRIEMSLSPPTDIPTDPYELGKYGEIAVEYTRVANLDGGDMGLAAQALHVAHHLLFYSMGLSSDVNNDGMFIMSIGLAHYQTGNSRAEPFVDAPFMRFRFQSSPQDVFVYSEIETTMHFRSYIEAMAGLGIRLSSSLRIIGGFIIPNLSSRRKKSFSKSMGLKGLLAGGCEVAKFCRNNDHSSLVLLKWKLHEL
jgi:hypothetical protein